MIYRMTDPRDLAEAIKRLRGGRSQKEVAEKAGIDPSTWSAYEQGERPPRTRERFEQIARGLGCTPDLLEEVAWECRTQRLEKGERMEATKEREGPRADSLSAAPLEQAIEARLTTIHQELKEVLLLVADPKRSRS
jgi:transcriptional regulator with XRE-family HTH domain